MRAWLATVPAWPGGVNEDFAAISPSAAVLLDGAGIPHGVESGCVHGVAWFARTLGTVLLAEIEDPPARPLADSLAAAISRVRLMHEGACDLAHPGSPTATVLAIRVAGGQLDYLVLADSSIVLTGADGGSEVITDRRLDEVLSSTRATVKSISLTDPGYPDAFRRHILEVQRLRNSPGGFWVASPDPAAARNAMTGSRPLASLRSVLLLSDGASRPADLFGLETFAGLAERARTQGPRDLVRLVREAEASDPDGRRWRRSKAHDDVTAVYCDELGS